jgi:hypothetical protein
MFWVSVEEENMKARVAILALALCSIGAAVCLAADDFVGTWKLNEAKSKLTAGGPKNTTVVYEAAGDMTKVTVDGVDADGKTTHNEWTGKFDGKEYAVTGDSTSDMRSYKKINDRTLSFTATKAGKVTLAGRIELSADGKSRTVTTHPTDSSGKKITNVAVYDKQ